MEQFHYFGAGASGSSDVKRICTHRLVDALAGRLPVFRQVFSSGESRQSLCKIAEGKSPIWHGTTINGARGVFQRKVAHLLQSGTNLHLHRMLRADVVCGIVSPKLGKGQESGVLARAVVVEGAGFTWSGFRVQVFRVQGSSVQGPRSNRSGPCSSVQGVGRQGSGFQC